MASGDAEPSAPKQPLELHIKNPSRLHDEIFKLTVAASDTLGQVKATLQKSYPGSPDPHAVTLIYAGKLLKNDVAPLASYLPLDGPVVLHVVVEQPAPSSPKPRPAVSPAQQPSPAATPSPRSQPQPARQPARQPAGTAERAGSSDQEPTPAVSWQYPDHDGDMQGRRAGYSASTPPHGAGSGRYSGPYTPPFGSHPVPAYATYTVPAQPPSPLGPAYAAAYAAALKALMGEAPPAAAGSADAPPNTEARSSAGAAATPPPAVTAENQPSANPTTLPIPHPSPPPAIAYVPAYIPVPQPVLPPAFFNNGQQQQQQQQQATGGNQQGLGQAQAQGQALPGQFYVPQMMMPNPYAWQHMQGVPQQYGQYPYGGNSHFGGNGNGQFNFGVTPPPQMRQRRRGAGPAAEAPPPGPQRVAAHLEQRDMAVMLRALQEQRGDLPAGLAELLEQLDRQPAAAAAAAGAAGRGEQAAARPGRGIQMRIQINMRTLLQLAVLLVVVYQHCPPRRFLLLVLLGMALYLTTTPPVRRLLRQLAGLGPGPGEPFRAQPAPPMAAGGVPAAAPEAPAPAAPVQPVQPAGPQAVPVAGGIGGMLREVQAFVVGFITSLLPGLDRNADDHRNFGAVQDMFGGAQADGGAAQQAGGNAAP